MCLSCYQRPWSQKSNLEKSNFDRSRGPQTSVRTQSTLGFQWVMYGIPHGSHPTLVSCRKGRECERPKKAHRTTPHRYRYPFLKKVAQPQPHNHAWASSPWLSHTFTLSHYRHGSKIRRMTYQRHVNVNHDIAWHCMERVQICVVHESIAGTPSRACQWNPA